MIDVSDPITLHGAAVALRSGGTTVAELLEQCLARVDRYEPAVRAWAHLDRDAARAQARQLDGEMRAGRIRGQLHGIPVGVKDTIDVAGMPTRHGADFTDATPATADAPVVARLREAGAVLLGKTITTPFAYLDPSPTRNPWDLGRTPGGSSSGSAAAVACGMCLTALGTQTGASLTRPASYCGANSFKPTHGRVPVCGVLPLAPTLDHVGVIARSCAGLTAMVQAILDPAPEPPRRPRDRGDDDSGLQVAVGAVPQAGDRMHGLFARFEDTLTRGAGWPRLAVPAAFERLPAANRAVYAFEAARSHAERFAADADRYPPKLRELVEEGHKVSEKDYRAALALRDELSCWLAPGRWLILPATEDLPPGPETTGSPVMSVPWSFTGLPTASVVVGWHDGLPYAAQIVGACGTDRALLAVASMVEHAAGAPHPLPPAPAAP